jgi:hypothetical protein
MDTRNFPLNSLLPDIFSLEYTQFSSYVNPRTIIDFLYDHTLRVVSSINRLDSAVILKEFDLEIIKFDILAGFFYRGLNNFMQNQRHIQSTHWYMDNMGWWPSSELQGTMHELCIKCLDTSNHSRTLHLCFDRLEEKGFGHIFRCMKNLDMIDPKKHLFFAASELLNLSAGPSWHSLGTGDANISYNVAWSTTGLFRPILDDMPRGVGWSGAQFHCPVPSDYFTMVRDTLAIIKPQAYTWIALEYFSRLTPNDKSEYRAPMAMEVVREAMAYLFHLQELRRLYPRIIVVLPLTPYRKGMPLTDYLARQQYTYQGGLIMQKLCAKLRILAVPTQGWIEAVPIMRKNAQPCEYYSACLGSLVQQVVTRNPDGQLNREGRRRFIVLMNLVVQASDFAEKMIGDWQYKFLTGEMEQDGVNFDPTLLQDL